MIRIIPEYDCDVLVVGAGPAGAAAAAYLAKANAKVVMVDRQKFPRDKVCGDFVGPAALLELKQLGVTQNPAYQKSNKIRQASLYLNGKLLINQSLPRIDGLPPNGRVIPRMLLDHWIVEAACDAGAALMTGYKLTDYHVDDFGVIAQLQTAEGVRSMRTRLLIGADGSSSVVARKLRGDTASPADRIIAVRAYFENVSGAADCAELYFTEKSFPGYYWLFPTGKSAANVGVGMVLETVPPTEAHLRDLLYELIENDPALHQRLNNARMIGKVVGWPLTTYNPSRRLVGERVMLTGDAAGLINPLNGEGIQYALLSGRWAAETAVNCLRQGAFDQNALQPYAQTVADAFRYDMALAGFIVHMIRNRTLNPVWLEALQIIVSRARLDAAYAEVAGGILAGLLPASKAVNPSFLMSTLEQTVMSLGISTITHAFGGPAELANVGMRYTALGWDIVRQTARHPVEMVKWGLGVSGSVFELTGQISRDLFSAVGEKG